MDVFHERPIHTAISVSFAFMMQDRYPEMGLEYTKNRLFDNFLYDIYFLICYHLSPNKPSISRGSVS